MNTEKHLETSNKKLFAMRNRVFNKLHQNTLFDSMPIVIEGIRYLDIIKPIAYF